MEKFEKRENRKGKKRERKERMNCVRETETEMERYRDRHGHTDMFSKMRS